MPWKAVGRGLGVNFSVPPTRRMLRGWEGQAAGDPENYHVQGETLSERLCLSAEVTPVDALLRCCAATPRSRPVLSPGGAGNADTLSPSFSLSW